MGAGTPGLSGSESKGRRDVPVGRTKSAGEPHHLARFAAIRILIAVPQIIGVTFLTFLILRLLPTDPALAILGPYATPEGIARVRGELGLDQPLWTQYWTYIVNAASGDLGTSWQTSRPVLDDILRRFPATLELITIALALALAIGVTLGVSVATGKSRLARRGASAYGLVAGALPEFWVALILIEVFFTQLQLPGIAPPAGQISLGLLEPTRITGAIAVDALLTGNWPVLASALSHLILPVATLVIVLVGPILKLTRASVEEALASDAIWYMRAAGHPERAVVRRAVRMALPSILTLSATNYTYLIGGAVLVESVFSWGGAGQYAVQAIQNADLMAIQGFVLIAGTLTVLIYLVLDLANAVVDPRATISGGNR